MNKYVTGSIKAFGWALALLGTAFTVYNGIKGPGTCPEGPSFTCGAFNLNWWALGLEWFCLAIFAALDVCGVLGRAYVAMTGLFVFASTQLQMAPWVGFLSDKGLRAMFLSDKEFLDTDMPEKTLHLVYAGNALLFGANLFLAMGMGLEHYVQPKLSDDKAPLPVDIKAGGEVRSMATIRRNGELLVTVRRWLGLVLACVGAVGMIMALVLHAKFCENENENENENEYEYEYEYENENENENDCARNWWMYPVQLFAFAAYIVTEVILEVPSFRPVLTILLATQIGVFEASALEASGEGVDYRRQVAGVIIAISVSYILFLTLPGPVTSKPSSGQSSLLLGVVPTAAALLGVVFAYPIFFYMPLNLWRFAMYPLALVWIMTSHFGKVSFLSNFRLPLVAFISNTIQWEAFSYHVNRLRELGHAWRLRELMREHPDSDFDTTEQDIHETVWIGIVMLIVSFVMIIFIAGTSWEGSIRPKRR